jgi:hypothetical protein
VRFSVHFQGTEKPLQEEKRKCRAKGKMFLSLEAAKFHLKKFFVESENNIKATLERFVCEAELNLVGIFFSSHNFNFLCQATFFSLN